MKEKQKDSGILEGAAMTTTGMKAEGLKHTPWTNSIAFRVGWDFGRKHRREVSMREALDMHPAGLNYDNAEAFTQGVLDGIQGDRFRLDYKKS